MFQANFAAVSNRSEPPQQNTTLQGRGLFVQRGGVDVEAVGRLSGQDPKPAFRQFVEPLAVLAGEPGRPGDCRTGIGPGSQVQLGEHAMTNSVPGVLEVRIRVVLNPGLTDRPQILAQLLTRNLEERADHIPSLRVDAAETRHAGAANELEQKRLGLVVARMANGQTIGANLHRTAVQALVAKPPGRVFDREPLRRRIGPDVHGLDRDRQIESGRELATELLVAGGFGPELVIDVSQTHQAEAPVHGEIAKEKRQRYRVGSAREADKDTTAWRTQRVSADRAPDFLEDPIQGSMPNAQCRMHNAPKRDVELRALRIGHWALRIGH
jgi:hypothetical protein